MFKILGSYNKDVDKDVLEMPTKNSKYISLEIHKEILSFFARMIRTIIHEDIGGCIVLYYCW